jgi:hypothetical protein
MPDLVQHLRALCDAEHEEISVAGVTYWSDDHLQDILDRNVTWVEEHPLTWQPDTVSGGSIEYHRMISGYRDLEGTASGTAYWRITTSDGSTIMPDDLNMTSGEFKFDADQGGTSYYITARSFDVYGAAADVWLWRLAQFQKWYDFASDGQTFNREQAYDHAVRMEREMRARSGQNTQPGGIQSGVFLRTDVETS